jgi:hypothetical protein
LPASWFKKPCVHSAPLLVDIRGKNAADRNQPWRLSYHRRVRRITVDTSYELS